jgi:uncharacterized protein YcaQ
MPEPRQVAAATARRFLALRHFLCPPRSLPAAPESILKVIERLGSLQFDPLSVAGRNHDLVLHARIQGYRPEWTDRLLYETRQLFEAYNKGLSLLPTAELPWYRITWQRGAAVHAGALFQRQPQLVERVLARIRDEGPLSSLDFERGAAMDWYWGPTNEVRATLEALSESGVLGLARRAGNRRYYDLIERLFPPELLDLRVDEREQLRHKLLSRYRAHGLLGASGSAELWSGISRGPATEGDLRPRASVRAEVLAELVEREELVPVAVEGVRGVRYVVAGELPLLEEAERELAAGELGAAPAGAALLAPLDPLVWDRDFLRSLYRFDYIWEVYVPEAKRRWGYYVLPILFADRLVGRIEPRIDRPSGVVRILGLWWEAGFEGRTTAGLADAISGGSDGSSGRRVCAARGGPSATPSGRRMMRVVGPVTGHECPSPPSSRARGPASPACVCPPFGRFPGGARRLAPVGGRLLQQEFSQAPRDDHHSDQAEDGEVDNVHEQVRPDRAEREAAEKLDAVVER